MSDFNILAESRLRRRLSPARLARFLPPSTAATANASVNQEEPIPKIARFSMFRIDLPSLLRPVGDRRDSFWNLEGGRTNTTTENKTDIQASQKAIEEEKIVDEATQGQDQNRDHGKAQFSRTMIEGNQAETVAANQENIPCTPQRTSPMTSVKASSPPSQLTSPTSYVEKLQIDSAILGGKRGQPFLHIEEGKISHLHEKTAGHSPSNSEVNLESRPSLGSDFGTRSMRCSGPPIEGSLGEYLAESLRGYTSSEYSGEISSLDHNSNQRQRRGSQGSHISYAEFEPFTLHTARRVRIFAVNAPISPMADSTCTGETQRQTQRLTPRIIQIPARRPKTPAHPLPSTTFEVPEWESSPPSNLSSLRRRSRRVLNWAHKLAKSGRVQLSVAKGNARKMGSKLNSKWEAFAATL